MQTNKKYWLRGAVILSIIYIIFFIVFMINLYATESGPHGGFGFGLIALVLLGLPSTLLIEPFAQSLSPSAIQIIDHSGGIAAALVFIFSVIQYFIIGAVLGWLYGKIKNRNK